MPSPPPWDPPLVGFKTIRNISRIWIMIYMLNPTRGGRHGGNWHTNQQKSVNFVDKICMILCIFPKSLGKSYNAVLTQNRTTQF